MAMFLCLRGVLLDGPPNEPEPPSDLLPSVGVYDVLYISDFIQADTIEEAAQRVRTHMKPGEASYYMVPMLRVSAPKAEALTAAGPKDDPSS